MPVAAAARSVVGLDATGLAPRQVIVDTGAARRRPGDAAYLAANPAWRWLRPNTQIGELCINALDLWLILRGNTVVSDGDACRVKATRFDRDRVTIAGEVGLGMAPPFARRPAKCW